jgi:hypothetical protein
VSRHLLSEPGGGAAAGDGPPLKRLERHPVPGPHDQLTVEDQAIGQVGGRVDSHVDHAT